MAFPTVDINQTGGNSGRAAEGFDYYSGIIFYGTAPSVTGKWTSYPGPPVIKAQQLFSPDDATTAGIIPFTDNTASTATYEITTAATAAGETLVISVDVPKPNSTSETIYLGLAINSGVYTTVSGDTVIDTLGANLATFINAGTVENGFSASYNSGTDTLTITAPKNLGISLNSGTPYDFDETNTDIVGNITQNVVAGTLSYYAIWKYHIDEYFRIYGINNGGNLWVGIISDSSSFNEVGTLEVASGNKIRQAGIWDNNSTRGSAANIKGTITQLDVATKVLEKTSPFISVYSPNIYSVSDLSTYPDQNTNTANTVQCVISQDGDAAGALLFVKSGVTIGNVGAKLASIAKSRVSASDAQPIEAFNNSDGVENNVPAFGNGLLAVNVSNSLQVQLDSYRYTFFRQFGDTVVGTYWTGNKTCIVSTNSYCNVNDNRVSQKVVRICYSTYIPLLNGELFFNSDGTLRLFTVESFKDSGQDAITADMITGFGDNPLISGVSVDIDPTQNVKATENLIVNVTINENGIARKITVNIGYGTV